MKKLLVVFFAVAAATMLVAPAFATELWDPHLHGVNEGLAAGALPPPGVYFINNSYFAPSFNYSGSSNPAFAAPSGHASPNFKLFGYVDVPILLWVPGCKFLGADYGMAIAQPFDYTNLRIQIAPNVFVGGAQWGTFNTIIVPYELAWKLPCDFRIKTGFGIALDDATSSPGMTSYGPGPYAFAGNGTYTFEPTLGLSWLHAGWNLSVDFHYAFQTENNATHYQSGDQIAVDYTATYTCGKWTFGVGAAEETQVSSDSFDRFDGTGFHSQSDTKANLWSAGPIIGYNFGPCSLQFVYNFPIYTNNDVGGEWFNVRLVVPLWK